MNKIYLILFLIFIIRFDVNSQSCLPEGIVFWNQDQVDNFQTNYPNCSEIEGNVTIRGTITNLDSLFVLTAIDGDLTIGNPETGGPNLQNMIGLDNLENIGGTFIINESSSISSFAGLGSLKEIGGDFLIQSITQFTNFLGLDSLSSINGNLHILYNNNLSSLIGLENLNIGTTNSITIRDNENLTSCEIQNLCNYLSMPTGAINIFDNGIGCNSPEEIAFGCGIDLTCLPYGNYHFQTQSSVDNFAVNYNNCTEIEGSIIIYMRNITNLNGLVGVSSISDDLSLTYNDSLSSIIGLSSLQSVGGNLSLTYNDSLSSLIGLNSLQSIGGRLSIAGSPFLSDLEGLGNLSTIGGHFHIHSSGIVNFQGLNNLTVIGEDLILGSNDSLTSLTGLENLTTIGGYLTIWMNDSLTNIMSLNNLNSIGNNIRIEYNPSLLSLDGLDNITSMVGLKIHNNVSLTSLSGLNNLILIEKDLQILRNGIQDFQGLSNLTTVNGRVGIRYNNAISNFNGLEKLSFIGGDFWVAENKNLSSFNGLENLTTLQGSSLKIETNDNLLSLSGLDNINPEHLTYVMIYSNPVLSECDVNSICDYLLNTSGNTGIGNNALGCNSSEEIEATCVEWITDAGSESIFSIYPNPAISEVFILCENGTRVENINIYNQLGQKVLSEKNKSDKINISNLNNGIYIIELISKDFRIRKKLIIN